MEANVHTGGYGAEGGSSQSQSGDGQESTQEHLLESEDSQEEQEADGESRKKKSGVSSQGSSVRQRRDDQPKRRTQDSDSSDDGSKADRRGQAEGESGDGAESDPGELFEQVLESLPEEQRKRLLKARRELKVNGQKKQVSLEEAFRYMQKDMAGDQKIQKSQQEIERMSALMNKIVDLGKQDPGALLKKFGHDPMELAKRMVQKQIRREMMSPEEIQAEEEREQAIRDQQELKALKEQREREEYERAVGERRQYWEKAITDTLQKHDLPKTPFTIMRMRDYIKAAKKRGYKEVHPEMFAEQVQKDYDTEFKQYYLGRPIDRIIDTFGTELVDRIREWDVSRVTQEHKQSEPSRPQKQAQKPKKRERRGKTWEELEREWEERANM